MKTLDDVNPLINPLENDKLCWNNTLQKYEPRSDQSFNSSYYITGYCTNVVNTFTLSTGSNPLHYPSVINWIPLFISQTNYTVVDNSSPKFQIIDQYCIKINETG